MAEENKVSNDSKTSNQELEKPNEEEKEKKEDSPKEKPADEKPVKEEREEKPTVKKPEEKKVKKEEKAPANLSDSAKKVLEMVEKMNVLELSELVKAIEEKFGVSGQMPVMGAIAAAPANGNGQEEAKEEQTSFNIVLTNFGSNKIGVIKAVRQILPDLGLKEAKDLVESAPKPIKEGVSKEEANEAKKKLEEAGAAVEIK